MAVGDGARPDSRAPGAGPGGLHRPQGELTLHRVELGDRGTPVAMLHGLLIGNLATWYFTAAPLLARDHRVLLYDLRSHGRSVRVPDGYDVRTMAGDLERLLERFAPDEPCVLVGHSYGALVALRFALSRPERVGKLVLVEAPLPPSRFAELDAFLASSPEQMLAALPEGIASAFRQGKRQARRLLDGLRFLTLETSLVADLRAETDIPDAELARLTCPVLCVYGTRSSCRPVGARLASVFPQGELVEIEGGHYLPLEAPSELGKAITRFVDG